MNIFNIWNWIFFVKMKGFLWVRKTIKEAVVHFSISSLFSWVYLPESSRRHRWTNRFYITSIGHINHNANDVSSYFLSLRNSARLSTVDAHQRWPSTLTQMLSLHATSVREKHLENRFCNYKLNKKLRKYK